MHRKGSQALLDYLYVIIFSVIIIQFLLPVKGFAQEKKIPLKISEMCDGTSLANCVLKVEQIKCTHTSEILCEAQKQSGINACIEKYRCKNKCNDKQLSRCIKKFQRCPKSIKSKDCTLLKNTILTTCYSVYGCSVGETCCKGQCVNLQTFQTDVSNCGSCNHACGTGETCCKGQCVNLQTFQTDVSNCGNCNHACSSGQFCNGGQCTYCPNESRNTTTTSYCTSITTQCDCCRKADGNEAPCSNPTAVRTCHKARCDCGACTDGTSSTQDCFFYDVNGCYYIIKAGDCSTQVLCKD